MSKGIFAALEELDEGSAIYGDTPYGEGIEGAEEDAHEENLRREASDEINLTANHLGDLNEVVDQSQGAVDDLTAIGDSLSTESEVFNIDEVSIKPTIIAVEALYRKLGVKEITLPSLESFSDSDSSKLAVEHLKISIEEKAEEAKSGIAKMIEKIWNFIKELFGKVISSFEKIFKPNLNKLIKKFEALKATEPKEKTVKDDRLIKAFGKPGSNVSKGEVSNVLGKLMNLIDVTDRKDSGNISDLPFDTTIEIKIDNENKVEVEIKSGWDGKEVGDKTIELSNKSECIEILKEMASFSRMLEDGIKEANSISQKLAQKAKNNKESDDEIKSLEKRAKISQKATPKALAIFTKTISAGIDYCNKSYKEIKANEGGKEEKEEGNKE